MPKTGKWIDEQRNFNEQRFKGELLELPAERKLNAISRITTQPLQHKMVAGEITRI
jgi:hypothetical protein